MMRYLIGSTLLLLILVAAITGCGDATPTATDADAIPLISDPVEATAVNFANTKCPIMGGKPTSELTAEYEGKTIGFCCEGCPEKWAALDEDVKAEKFAKVDAQAGHDHGTDDDHAGHDHAEDATDSPQ
ncbi:hypothetical protein NZK35_24585 [Stieleria sp. ICT_E10.1]|uniref:hypothetical protein n=1 Tax=Stieleria sedimenti TaxID=2976331 RepID=UPI00217F66F5|nr:hypothetical protein [Stieleria sedimenti]MCS7469842.1 hypothetical protein [Stieleria sedimenti]